VISWQFLLRLARFNRVVLSALFFMTAAAALPARADDWPDPAKWVGKSPLKGPNGTQFYMLTSVRAPLIRLAGDQFYRRVILGWSEYSPIMAAGDSMVVWGCKPHACDTNQVAAVIQGRNISVCTFHISVVVASDSESRVANRLWLIQGLWLPVVERDPLDGVGCQFKSIEDAKTKLQKARAMADQY